MWDAFKKEQLDKAEKEEEAKLEDAARAFEAGEVTKDQLIEEGIWDRLRARGAGAVGAAKDIGKRVKGAAAGFTGKAQPEQKFTGGMDAKTASIANTHIQKITKAIADFQNDMTKLGLDPDTMRQTSPEAGTAIDTLNRALNSLKTNFEKGVVSQKVGAVQKPAAAPAAPAPAPATAAAAPAPA
jgi:hypothetical protein